MGVCRRRSGDGGSGERQPSPGVPRGARGGDCVLLCSLTLLSIGEGTDGRRVSARLGFVPEGRLAPAVVVGRAGLVPPRPVSAAVVGRPCGLEACERSCRSRVSGSVVGKAEAESLILAQNERWRRA